MNIIKVTDSKLLKKLVDKSALTIEGLAESSFGDFQNWVRELAGLVSEDVYVMSGEFLNSEWNLTGSNAYPGDLNVVSIMLDDMKDYEKIVMPRFEIGGRWLDDVYDNNIRREHEKAA